MGMTEIEGKKPYEDTGIQEGDRIIKMNENTISSTEDLMQEVKESEGKNINITYMREEETMVTSMKPAKTASNEYKLGLWVRDAAAGAGDAQAPQGRPAPGKTGGGQAVCPQPDGEKGIPARGRARPAGAGYGGCGI